MTPAAPETLRNVLKCREECRSDEGPATMTGRTERRRGDGGVVGMRQIQAMYPASMQSPAQVTPSLDEGRRGLDELASSACLDDMFRHASPKTHHIWIGVEGGSVAFEVGEALVLRLDDDLVVDPATGDQNADEVSPFSPQTRFSSVSASLKWPYLIV